MRCFGVAGVLLLVAARSVVEGACTQVSNSDELQAVAASGASCAQWTGKQINGAYPELSLTLTGGVFLLDCAEKVGAASFVVNAATLQLRNCQFIGVTSIKGDYATIEDNKVVFDQILFVGAVELYGMHSQVYNGDLYVKAYTPDIQTIVKVVYGSLTGKYPLRIFHEVTVEPTANEVRGMEVISADVDLQSGVWMEHVHSNSGCCLFVKGDACAGASFKATSVGLQWCQSVTGSGVHVEGAVEMNVKALNVNYNTGRSVVSLGDVSVPNQGVSQLKVGVAVFFNNTVGAVLRQTRLGHTEIDTLTTTGSQVEEAVVSNAGYFETSTWHSKCDLIDTTASPYDLMLLTTKGSKSTQKVETLVVDATDNGDSDADLRVHLANEDDLPVPPAATVYASYHTSVAGYTALPSWCTVEPSRGECA